MEITRSLYSELREHLKQEEITLLIGPRQAGKTTLLKKLAQELMDAGNVCLFFNLDIDTDAQFFTSQSRFLERVDALAGRTEAYVFIDEVQRIENARLFLKGLFDRKLPYKLIATGSGSLELKEKIAESLVGRKRNFYLSTVSIREFVNYKTDIKYRSNINQLLATDQVLADQLLREYLAFGGYPRVVTSETFEEKRKILAEIFQGYVERDIQLLLKLEKSQAFTTLLQLLASRSGKMINYNDLANLTGIAIPTLKNYLWYSEKTFITEGISPFFRNKEKEIVKAPQYYFLDSGLRNFLLGSNDLDNRPEDFGFLFQQMVFHLLKDQFKNTAASIHYWRTQNQAEVDFVVDKGISQLPVEVKATSMHSPQIQRSFRSFIDHYHPPEAWIINRSLKTTIQISDTKVHFRPWYSLL